MSGIGKFTCLAIGCNKTVHHPFACKNHWGMLTPTQQKNIYSNFTRRAETQSKAFFAAIKYAAKYLKKNELKINYKKRDTALYMFDSYRSDLENHYHFGASSQRITDIESSIESWERKLKKVNAEIVRLGGKQ